MTKCNYCFELKSSLSELNTLCRHLEDCSDKLQLPPKCRSELNLGLDELFTNIISYGFQDDSEHQIKFSLAKDDETLVVVSSDLSHYLDYESARRLDDTTRDAVEALRPGGVGHVGACGCEAMKGLLQAARNTGLQATTLDLRNSGDTAGNRDRVVGYGAWVFREGASCREAA